MSYCKFTKQWLPAEEMLTAVDGETGKKVLIAPTVETFFCEECGKEVTGESIRTGNGICVCKHCLEEEYEKCYWCESYHKKFYINIIQGKNICDNCIDECFYCKDCGERLLPDAELIEVRDGRYICENCRNNYVTCCQCNELISYSNACEDDDDNYYCRDCFDEYTRECCECGVIRHIDEMNYCNDEWYCSDCEPNNLIREYGYDPEFHFLKTLKDKKDNLQPKEYFGIEAEYAGDESYVEKFSDIVQDYNEEMVYFKHDGSVDGFEIVSQPMTRNYIYEVFKPNFEKGLQYLKDMGFKGHNYGGIHIHISSKAVSYKQLKNMIKLIYANNTNSKLFWLKVSQRRKSELEQWASIDKQKLGDELNYDKYTQKLYRIKDKLQQSYKKPELLKKINQKITKENNKYIFKTLRQYEEEERTAKPYLSDSRYMAINTRNYNTIEIRIFNSNLRIERVMKNFEVVFSLLDFTATDEMPVLRNYIKFIMKNKDKYTYLADFLIEKNICKTDECKDKLIRKLTNLPISFDDLSKQIDNIVANLENNNETQTEEERNVLCV